MKFALILCLALIAVSSERFQGFNKKPLKEIDPSKVIDYVIAAFKGMAKTDAYKCSTDLYNGKADILKIVNECIESIKSGTSIATALTNAALKLAGIKGVMSDCNIMALPGILSQLTTKNGLTQIFTRLLNGVDSVYEAVQGIQEGIKNKNFEEVAINGGKIFALTFNFYVN